MAARSSRIASAAAEPDGAGPFETPAEVASGPLAGPKRPYTDICAALDQSGGGGCFRCGKALPPRRRIWCSTACMDWWHSNHRYTVARRLALARSEVFAIPRCREIHGRSTKSRLHRHSLGYACAHCGGLFPARQSRARKEQGPAVQVNHIIQALGLHGSLDCVHHQENLEVLCEPCHRLVTNAQARGRRRVPVEPGPGAPPAPGTS